MKRTAAWIFLAMNATAAWVALIVADDPASRADEAQVGPSPVPGPTPSPAPVPLPRPSPPPLNPRDGGR
jgi:hypothetical protein